MTDLKKIISWENVKEKSLWVNNSFEEVKEKNSEDQPFLFFLRTSTLNNMLKFSMNLIDDKNQQINYNDFENKISILNFKVDVFFEMSRKLRPWKSPYQRKKEQISFLLEDKEKNFEEYKKIIETKDRQLVETKKVLKRAKSSS